MSLRGLLLGAIALALLGGGVWWSERQKPAEDTKAAGSSPKLVSLKDDDVAAIEIRRREGEPAVLRKDKSGWQLAEPKPTRVDNDAVTTLVSTFTGLAWDRLVEEKASDLSAFGLQSPAMQLAVTGKDKKSQTLLIGDETPTGGGFFAKLADDPRVFSIMSGTKSSLDKSWKDLQDKRLLTFDDTKLSRLEVTAKAQSAEFGRNAQSEWQMVKPRPLRADNLQVEELVRKLKDARMETASAEEDEKAAAGKFASASRVATVNTTDASGTQTLEIRRSGEDYLAKSSVLEGIHKVSKDLGEALNKGVGDYRNKKLFDFGFNDPSKIVIRDGEKTYDFTKGGDKWWVAGKEMDATSVQSVIDKLRDLSASEFVETAPGAPALEVNVTSNNGKRTEKVVLAKSGDAWLARRENELAVYKIESKLVDEIQKSAADVKAPSPPASPQSQKK